MDVCPLKRGGASTPGPPWPQSNRVDPLSPGFLLAWVKVGEPGWIAAFEDPPCFNRPRFLTCSHLSCRLDKFLRQLLLAGKQRQPVDHLARGPHQMLRHGRPPSDLKQVRQNRFHHKDPPGFISQFRAVFLLTPRCPRLFALLCAAKKNSSSSTGSFQTSTRWTSLIFGSGYQVPNTLDWLYSRFSPTSASVNVNLPLARASTDKDQDGHFRWVDKTEVTFSNYGPGWPQNTANIWDCGQIFTGGKHTNAGPSARGGRSPDRGSVPFSGNYDGLWETTNCFKSLGYICEMTGGQNPKPTSAPGQSDPSGPVLRVNNRVITSCRFRLPLRPGISVIRRLLL